MRQSDVRRRDAPMNSFHSVQQFCDADEHAQSVANLTQTYFQIESGAFRSTLRQCDLNGIGVFSESANRRVVESGHPSPGTVLMAWISSGPLSTMNPDPRDIGGLSISTARSGEDWMVQMPADTELVGITVPTSEFARLADSLGSAARNKVRQRKFQPQGEASSRALLKLRTGVEAIRQQTEYLACPDARTALRQRILDDLFAVLDEAAPPDRGDSTRMAYCDIVKRSQEFVLRNAGYPTSVLDLCAALRISRRTMHTAFTVITGQSPVAYLRSIRLGQVRKLLRGIPASQMTIASAAARCGFIHLGNFANDYRQLFGELPSHTPRRRTRY